MSLLLDALRKSANERRLGSPPGLEEGLRQMPSSGPRQRSWLTPVLLVAIIVAVVVWQPWQDEDGAWWRAEPETATVQDAGNDDPAAGAVTAVGTGTDAASTAQRPQSSAAGGSAASVAQNERTPAPTARQSGGRERAVANNDAADDYATDHYNEADYFEPDDSAYVAQQLRLAAGIGEIEGESEEDVEIAEALLQEIVSQAQESGEYAEFADQVLAEEQAAALAGVDELAGEEPAGEPFSTGLDDDEPPGRPTSRQSGRQTQRQVATAHDPADSVRLLSYYDLPVNVRTSLPDVNVQIRVYDEDPQRRFVVSGRNRIHEGEQLADGVRLQEVRKDGVVLAYQSYVFLWDKR